MDAGAYVANMGSGIHYWKIKIRCGFIQSKIQDVLVADVSGELIPARGLAKILGRIADQRRQTYSSKDEWNVSRVCQMATGALSIN